MAPIGCLNVTVTLSFDTGAFQAAFENYFAHDDVKGFGGTPAATRKSLGLKDINAKVAFSPHTAVNSGRS